MKVTICTFDDSINHLPIAHIGGHQEMFDYLKEAYSFSNLVLSIDPVLDYIAFVDSDDMPEDIPLAMLNTVKLHGFDDSPEASAARKAVQDFYNHLISKDNAQLESLSEDYVRDEPDIDPDNSEYFQDDWDDMPEKEWDDHYGDGKDYDTPNTIHFEGDGEYPYGPNGKY